MRFSTAAVVLGLALGPLARTAPADDLASRARVRPLCPQAVALVNAARDRSPTVRSLLDRLQTSDVVVYVDVRPYLDIATARTVFMNASGGQRSLLVSINARNGIDAQLALLGHELEHATEVAQAPSVIDALSFARFYRTCGEPSRTAGSFETTAARETELAVWREIHARR